jgi:hypothetical protein
MIVTTPDPTAGMQIYSEAKDTRQARLMGQPAEAGLLTGDDPPLHLRSRCSA